MISAQDPNLTDNCSWTLGNTGNLRQTTNAYYSNTIQLGCNVMVTNLTVVDFIAQVDIDNDDNDAVGLNFGWASPDDHCTSFSFFCVTL